MTKAQTIELNNVELDDFDISHAADGFMTTYMGEKFSPLKPDPATVNIYDIAHALSLYCRWGGHLKKFYSVAQHSVMVSELSDPEDELLGLMHDAAEAYIGDMIRPLKYLKQMYTVYKKIEQRVDHAIALAFDIPTLDKTLSVERADAIVLAIEATQLRKVESPWAWETLEKFPSVKKIRIDAWDPEVAERKFLDRFNKLKGTNY